MVRRNVAVRRGADWALKVDFPSPDGVFCIRNSSGNSKEATYILLASRNLIFSWFSWSYADFQSFVEKVPKGKAPICANANKDMGFLCHAFLHSRWKKIHTTRLVGEVSCSQVRRFQPVINTGILPWRARDQPKSSGLKLLCRVHFCTESVERSANQQEKGLKVAPLKWKTRDQVNTNGMTGGKEIRF